MFAFPGILALHAIGMGFAVGICLALDLRVLGVAPGVRIAEMRRFVPVVWAAFWLNAVSGVLLLIGYPTKALTNPVFYLKLLLIGVGLWCCSGALAGASSMTPATNVRSRRWCSDSRSFRWCAGWARSPPAAFSPIPITG